MAKSYQNQEQKNESPAQLSPVSPNWENSEIAFLTSVTASEVCPDYSPCMLELSAS